MDITDFLIERGYKLESKRITPKGRGKTQVFCLINKKPIEQDLYDCEDLYGIEILKCTFKKGKELTILMKKSEDRKPQLSQIKKELTLDEVTEEIFGNELSREELRNLLINFQNSCFNKGFQTHKAAIKKLLEGI